MRHAIIAALAAFLGAAGTFAALRWSSPPRPAVGRFAPAPLANGRALLVDTATGDAWIGCEGAKGIPRWCLLESRPAVTERERMSAAEFERAWASPDAVPLAASEVAPPARW